MTDYLFKEDQRIKAIKDNTDQKIKFEHQEVTDVEEFKNGIFENQIDDINPLGIPVLLSLQDNTGAGVFVRQHSKTIDDAAAEFGVDPSLVKAFIYTEMSRGWYDRINPTGSPTVLPGNVDKSWEPLIPGSDVNNTTDNIRLTAKLISEIGKRLDEPYPEDIYSLYNGMAHDRTYENKETKNTPYFLKQVLKARAWEFDTWKLPNRLDVADIDPEEHGFPAGTIVDEQEGTIWAGETPGSDGVRLDRRRIFEKVSGEPARPDGFSPGRGDLFVPNSGGVSDPDRPGADHGFLPDVAPNSYAGFASLDDLNIDRMAQEAFASLTLDDWAIVPDENDPFGGRDPFADGVGWVPGLGPPPETP